MTERSKHTWYVSFKPMKPLPGKRRHSRVTQTFSSEVDAKRFAMEKLVETQNVSAGTLNPRLPKRTIAAAQLLEWLQEADDPDAPVSNGLTAHRSD
jgi:hypothetical protein